MNLKVGIHLFYVVRIIDGQLASLTEDEISKYSHRFHKIQEYTDNQVMNSWFDDLWFETWVYPHLVENHPVMSDYANFAKVIERLFAEVMRHNWDYFKNYIPKAD